MYYLQSRYYSPAIGRFISADAYATTYETPTGANLFAYCINNPVGMSDENGCAAETIFDIASLCGSTVDMIMDPSWSNLGYLFWDGVSVFAPGLPGSYAVKVIDKASDVAGLAETAKNLHRPYIRKWVREAVEAIAPKIDGLFIDPNLKIPIEGRYDLGHKSGMEFWRMRDWAMQKGMTQKEFNDFMNNPDFYQIEDPSSNRSRRFEDKSR